MKHAILGAGGVGGLMASSLAHCGETVAVVVRHEGAARYPDMLRLESPFGNFSVPVQHTTEVPAVDVLWIAVKGTQLETSLASIPDAVAISGIVPLLNGIDHVGRLRSLYGDDRVIPATIAVDAERVSPGHFVHRSPFVRLNLSSSGRMLLQSSVAKLQAFGFDCKFVDDEKTLLWSKLVFLAPVALTTSASGLAIGEIMANAEWKLQLQECAREVCAIASAEGATVHYESVISYIQALPGGSRSSMHRDVEQGNTPELEGIAGPILRGALRHRIDIPATRNLVTAVESRARQKARAGNS